MTVNYIGTPAKFLHGFQYTTRIEDSAAVVVVILYAVFVHSLHPILEIIIIIDEIYLHTCGLDRSYFYNKKAYKDEPSFRDAKVVFSVYEDDFKNTLSDDFATKLMLKGISKDDLSNLKEPVDYAALCKLAVDYSDGVIQNSKKVNESMQSLL